MFKDLFARLTGSEKKRKAEYDKNLAEAAKAAASLADTVISNWAEQKSSTDPEYPSNAEPLLTVIKMRLKEWISRQVDETAFYGRMHEFPDKNKMIAVADDSYFRFRLAEVTKAACSMAETVISDWAQQQSSTDPDYPLDSESLLKKIRLVVKSDIEGKAYQAAFDNNYRMPKFPDSGELTAIANAAYARRNEVDKPSPASSVTTTYSSGQDESPDRCKNVRTTGGGLLTPTNLLIYSILSD